MEKSKKEFIYAFDKKIKRKVPHVIKNGYAISLVTGNKINTKNKMIKLKKIIKTTNYIYFKSLYYIFCFLGVWLGVYLMELKTINNHIGCIIVLTISYMLWTKKK